jgi:hypothetical protein
MTVALIVLTAWGYGIWIAAQFRSAAGEEPHP